MLPISTTLTKTNICEDTSIVGWRPFLFGKAPMRIERLGPGAQRALVVAGGVAANQRLKAALEQVARENGFRLVVPPPELCTDNAAIIAWAGAERLARRLTDDLSAPARARWPLDPDAPPALGAGVKA